MVFHTEGNILSDPHDSFETILAAADAVAADAAAADTALIHILTKKKFSISFQ